MNKRYLLTILLLLAAFAVLNLTGGCIAQNASPTAEDFETTPVVKGSLSANIIANGSVHPHRSQDITWQIQGTIESVNAKHLEQVKIDQKLASLKQSSLPQSVILTQVELINAQNELENLQNSELASQNAWLTLVQAQNNLEDLQDERRLMDYNHCKSSTANTAYADYLLAEDNYERLQEDYDNFYAHKAEDDLSRANALSKLSAAQEEFERTRANLTYCNSKEDQLKVSEKDAEILVAQAKLEDAQREWERLKDGPDPDDITALESRITAYKATLSQAYLTAPFDGLLTYADLLPGDSVSAGALAYQIEDRSHLYVDVDISEIDINQIEVGQEVTLSFDAVYNTKYHGKVTQIGASGTNSQGVVNFKVVIELLDADLRIKSGMNAVVHIQVARVENALLVPNRAIRVQNDEDMVYVLRGSDAPAPQPVNLLLGLSDGIATQVLEGQLEEGEQVILNPDVLFAVGMPGPVMNLGGGKE